MLSAIDVLNYKENQEATIVSIYKINNKYLYFHWMTIIINIKLNHCINGKTFRIVWKQTFRIVSMRYCGEIKQAFLKNIIV